MRIIIVLLLTVSYYLNAQGLKTLDADFGIKNFKLETPYSLYKKDLVYSTTDRQGIEYYEYKKLDVKEIFGIPVKEIGLCYYDNKLYSISINFGTISKNQKLTLVENIKNKYDIPKIIQPNNNDKVFIAEWVTGKTYLQATEYDCLSTLSCRCKTELFIFSRNIKRKLHTD